MNVRKGVYAMVAHMMALKATNMLTSATKNVVLVKCMLKIYSCVLWSISARRNFVGLRSLFSLLIFFLNFAPEWTG